MSQKSRQDKQRPAGSIVAPDKAIDDPPRTGAGPKHQDDNSEPLTPREARVHARIVVIATVFMAVTSFVQWCAIRETNDLTRQAQGDSLALTREQMHTENRPFLVPSEFPLEGQQVREGDRATTIEFTANVPTIVRMTWINAGSSPALGGRGVTCFVVAVKKPGDPCKVSENTNLVAVTAPNQRSQTNVPVTLTADQIYSVLAGKETLWVLGSVRYTDNYRPEHTHYSDACFVWKPNIRTFEGCGGTAN